ncbi:MAG: alpha/beta hydrolase [Gemmatimonadaceae bacterium]
MAAIISLAPLCLPSRTDAQQFALWTHAAPGSEHWTQRERTMQGAQYGTVVFNVVTPTLTAYIPDPSTATGAAVIIAPGGSFRGVTIGLEGHNVARWFQERGIAAFVLKYRVLDYHAPGNAALSIDDAGRFAIADGKEALNVVRRRAAEWRIDPHRVGFLGFSAGGMIASSVLLQPDSSARPDFGVMVYGAPFGALPSIPRHLPPALLVWADDDPIARPAMTRLRDAMRSSGSAVGVRVYDCGGHGFGMRRQGTASDRWMDDLYSWLKRQGMTQRRVAASSFKRIAARM